MTLKELSQLKYLRKEISEEILRLEELQAEFTGANGTDYSKVTISGGKKYRSDVESRAIAIEALIEKVTELQIEHAQQELRIVEFIGEIPDAVTRLIFRYRYIDGLKWTDVADKMGAGWEIEAMRKRVYRYMDEDESAPACPSSDVLE